MVVFNPPGWRLLPAWPDIAITNDLIVVDGLPLQNVASDLPVEQHQLAVHRQRGALLRGVDAGLQLG